MANYYCMIAGLPDIDLQDAKPGLSLEDMREQCEEVLTPRDKKLLFYFFLHFDCVNLVKLLKDPEADIDQWGNFSLEQLRDLITSATELNFNVHRYPAFMSIFAREYAFNKDKAGYFPEDEMMFQFLDYAIRTCPSRMMRRWYKLNLDITNILTAMLARSQGWSVGDFIKGEGEVQRTGVRLHPAAHEDSRRGGPRPQGEDDRRLQVGLARRANLLRTLQHGSRLRLPLQAPDAGALGKARHRTRQGNLPEDNRRPERRGKSPRRVLNIIHNS